MKGELLFDNLDDLKNFYKEKEIMIGPNWIIIRPTKREICNFDKINRYHSNEKECVICKTKFNYGLKTTSICRCCKLYIKCKHCERYFETVKQIYFKDNIKSNKPIIAYCSKSCSNLGQKIYEHLIKFNEENKDNQEYQKKMYEARSYVGKNFGSKNIYKALEVLQNEHHDILVQNGKNVQKWLDKNPEERIRINTKLAQKYGKQNLEKARKFKIDIIKEQLLNISIKFNNFIINYDNIQILKQNDICGAYVIKGKFKGYKDSELKNDIFNLLVCKSIKIYNEIYWILRVLSQPEKQDRNDPDWIITKWWYIANLYYDFEFILLTDEKGVSENEALLTEAKYGIDNNMICNKEQIIRDGYSKTHSYWNL